MGRAKLKGLRLRQKELWLVEHGWWACDDGWRHAALYYPWPTLHACRLQHEALDGAQDPAHRMLRGEG